MVAEGLTLATLAENRIDNERFLVWLQTTIIGQPCGGCVTVLGGS
jgi:hypothetical protein